MQLQKPIGKIGQKYSQNYTLKDEKPGKSIFVNDRNITNLIFYITFTLLNYSVL